MLSDVFLGVAVIDYSGSAVAVSKNFLRLSIYGYPLLLTNHWNSVDSGGFDKAKSSKYVHSSTFSPCRAFSTTVKSPHTLTNSSLIYSVVLLYFFYNC